MRSKLAGPMFKPYLVLFLLVFGYSMFVLNCGVKKRKKKKKKHILKPPSSLLMCMGSRLCVYV